jgi:hypothetical protein
MRIDEQRRHPNLALLAPNVSQGESVMTELGNAQLPYVFGIDDSGPRLTQLFPLSLSAGLTAGIAHRLAR